MTSSQPHVAAVFVIALIDKRCVCVCVCVCVGRHQKQHDEFTEVLTDLLMYSVWTK